MWGKGEGGARMARLSPLAFVVSLVSGVGHFFLRMCVVSMLTFPPFSLDIQVAQDLCCSGKGYEALLHGEPPPSLSTGQSVGCP